MRELRHFQIGDRVRVIGPYADDWRDSQLFITAIKRTDHGDIEYWTKDARYPTEGDTTDWPAAHLEPAQEG